MKEKIKSITSKLLFNSSSLALRSKLSFNIYRRISLLLKNIFKFEYFLKAHRIETINEFLSANEGDKILMEIPSAYRNVHIPGQWLNGNFESAITKNAIAPYAYLAELRNCSISGGNSIVIRNESLLLDHFFYPSAERDRFTNHFRIFESVANRVLVEYYNTDIKIKECIYVGGAGSFNYYHWTLEHLSKFYFLSFSTVDKNIPIAVDEVSSSIPQFMQLLRCFTDREIIVLKAKQLYHVEKLYYATPLLWMVYYPKIGLSHIPEDCIIAEESAGYIRNKVLENYFSGNLKPVSLKKVPPLIFIMPPNRGWRNFNQSEVIEALIPLGFEAVSPQTLSLGEQIHIFQNAKLIIGASGAWMTNALYAKEGLEILVLAPLKDQNFFSNFTQSIRVILDQFITEPLKANDPHSNFTVDIESFKNVVQDYLRK